MQHGTADQYQHAVQSKTVKAGFGARPQAVGGITSKKKKLQKEIHKKNISLEVHSFCHQSSRT
jgi:hypothetical protein